MQVTVNYTNEVTAPFEESFFVRVAKETLMRCPLVSLKDKKEITMSVVAVSREKIQELNTTYRQQPKVTDILSFGEYADTAVLEQDTAEHIFLGEIFFCYDVIVAASEEDQVTIEHELIYIFSHGVLHLLGYDHSDEMFSLQDAVTEFFVEVTSKTNT